MEQHGFDTNAPEPVALNDWQRLAWTTIPLSLHLKHPPVKSGWPPRLAGTVRGQSTVVTRLVTSRS